MQHGQQQDGRMDECGWMMDDDDVSSGGLCYWIDLPEAKRCVDDAIQVEADTRIAKSSQAALVRV